MNTIPTIPAHVPLCHRNFDVAEQLALRAAGQKKAERPFFAEKQAFDALVGMFDTFKQRNPEIQNVWDYVEEFFQELKDKNSEGQSQQGQAIAQLDLDDNPGNQNEQDNESLLDLTDPQDRETSELQERVIKSFERTPQKKLIRNVGRIKAAIEKSFSFQRSRKTEEDPEHRDFSIRDIDSVRELARASEKYLHAIPEYEDLLLYRATRGELTSLKSVKPAKKTLFVMIDDSGSMDNGSKKDLVWLTLLKIREQLNENTSAYVFSFESALYDEYTDLAEKMPEMSFDGNGTDINAALNSLYKRMQNFNLEKYSILIINDGEDNPGNDPAPCPVSALMLMQENPKLKTLTEKSGGVNYKIV
jgi:uncharacterized protein with von Willebrand factor type A (vWA) domain